VSAIAAWIADPALWLAMAAVGLAGIVRGFAGFGSAMIMIPSLSAIYAPATAIPVGLLLEIILTVPFIGTCARLVEWPRLALLACAATLAVPLGVLALIAIPATILRWCISLIVLMSVAVLAFGWRYRGPPTSGATAAAGLLSGLLNGSVGMAGPPVVFFLLAGPDRASRVRATCIVYFGVIDAITVVVLAVRGLVGPNVLLLAALLAPSYLVAAWIGARFFQRTGEERYRRIALAILSLVAIGSLAA
jgi:uncharacterized membrane protein YfcA